jgi:hypothetical protein
MAQEDYKPPHSVASARSIAGGFSLHVALGSDIDVSEVSKGTRSSVQHDN